MRRRSCAPFVLAAALALAAPAVAQDPVHAFDLGGAVVLRAGEELALRGVATAPWGRARFLSLDVTCDGEHSGTLRIDFFAAPDQERPRIHTRLGLLPGLPTRVVLPLSALDGQSFFLPRQPRQLKGVMPGNRVAPADLAGVRLVHEKRGDAAATLRIERVVLTAAEPAPLPAPASPVVDALGQWTARRWPGKAGSEAEVVTALRSLHRRAARARLLGGRSRYGGFTALRFAATGFFRVERQGERWWLVDPEGCAFFSVGVDCVGPASAGPYAGMEELFAWLPEPDGRFAAACGATWGRAEVSFVTVNLIRAFGDDWRARWEELAAGLLRRWGFNTVGNWSDQGFAQRSGLPFVLPLGGFPSTRVALYRDFPDVFADEYAAASRRFAAQMAEHREDPFLIGYFLRNEPEWAFGANNLAAEMLATAVPSATRRALGAWLRQRYDGDAAALSAAWGVEVESFAALEERAWPDLRERSERARDDLWEFSARMVDRYLRLPSEALREVAPRHLNLGIRYAWISSELCTVGAGELFDVFSLNAYVDAPDPAQIAAITAATGLPVLIGEFHHGALDRGLPSTGIRAVATQAERGAAYRHYVERAAAIPSLVGVHYFQWHDQPVLGRFDGENYQIGLVDVCHRPHGDFVEVVRATHAGLLEVLTGARAPTTVRARAVPAVSF